MAEEEREGGITLGYIFRTIFSQKWLALIIAAVITIVGTLGLYFMGKKNEEYSVLFVSKIPDSENSPLNFVFPDGKEFRYETMISIENLETVKASDELFKNIDVKKMYEKGDISINRILAETVAGSKEYEATYKISANTKYFQSKIVARDFLSELSQFPIKYLSDMKIDYDRYLEASESAIQYDKQLDYLNSQAYFLSEGYTSFINTYGDNFVVKDGKTLSYYHTQLQAFLNRGDIDLLKNTALENSYVKCDENGEPLKEAIAKYRSEEFEKKREKKIAEDALQIALDKMLSSSEGHSSTIILDTETVMKYTEQIAKLEKELEEIGDFINKSQVNAEFDSEVSGVAAKLIELTDEFSSVASTVYSSRTILSYLNTSVVEVDGGRGLVMSAVIGLVAGIVIAAIVAYAVGWSKQKKAETAANAGAPVQSAPRLEAAATDAEENNDKK